MRIALVLGFPVPMSASESIQFKDQRMTTPLEIKRKARGTAGDDHAAAIREKDGFRVGFCGVLIPSSHPAFKWVHSCTILNQENTQIRHPFVLACNPKKKIARFGPTLVSNNFPLTKLEHQLKNSTSHDPFLLFHFIP